MIGIGDELTEYLVKDFPDEEFNTRAAANAADHVVGEVKNSVSGCGGDTQIVIASSDQKPERLSRETIQNIELHLGGFSKEQYRKNTESLLSMLLMGGIGYQPAPVDWWQPRSQSQEPDQGRQS